jgi:hypothetical protein
MVISHVSMPKTAAAIDRLSASDNTVSVRTLEARYSPGRNGVTD